MGGTMNKKFLVVGANFENQGAFLMLATIAQQLKHRFGASAVVDMKLGTAAQRNAVGVLTLAPRKVDDVLPSALKPSNSRLLPERMRLVRHSELDGVIDISGFRYGDQWEHLNLDFFAGRLKSLADRGVPVYMFPQAFGPFEKTAGPALKAVRASRLVMPRDPDSAAYLESILDGHEPTRVMRVPDFTGSTPGRPVQGLEPVENGVPVVPNWNIYTRGSGTSGDRYIDNIAELVVELRDMGYQPFGLSHEGERDLSVLRSVADRVGGLDIVSGLDGLELKWLIGQSSLLVAGRFHAISSGLSQGVPTLIHGWSHKYRWMAEDYGVERYAVDPYSEPIEQVEVLRGLAEDASLSEELRRRGAAIESTIDEMWSVFHEDFARARVGVMAP
jgi:polysaccharide pyruvyl transferase WcaK-like protein